MNNRAIVVPASIEQLFCEDCQVCCRSAALRRPGERYRQFPYRVVLHMVTDDPCSVSRKPQKYLPSRASRKQGGASMHLLSIPNLYRLIAYPYPTGSRIRLAMEISYGNQGDTHQLFGMIEKITRGERPVIQEKAKMPACFLSPADPALKRDWDQRKRTMRKTDSQINQTSQ